MIMKDQYIKETSQIHAPLELIQKTKQAVRAEEMRIRRESMPQASAIQSYSDIEPEGIQKVLLTKMAQPVLHLEDAQVTGQMDGQLESMQPVGNPESAGQGSSRKSHGKIYRWAMPVAAAVLLLSLNMFQNISKSDMSMSASDAAPERAGEAESAASVEEYMMWDAGPAEEAAEDSIMADKAQSGGETENSMMAAGAQSEGTEENSMDACAGQSSINDFVAADKADEAVDQDSELTVTEVKKMPEFFGEEDTEYITVYGIEFAVVQEGEDSWSAYTKIDAREYVIAGQAADLDDFTDRAYEMLTETIREW